MKERLIILVKDLRGCGSSLVVQVTGPVACSGLFAELSLSVFWPPDVH